MANRFVIIKWPSADAHDKMWTTHLKLWTEGEAKKIEFSRSWSGRRRHEVEGNEHDRLCDHSHHRRRRGDPPPRDRTQDHEDGEAPRRQAHRPRLQLRIHVGEPPNANRLVVHEFPSVEAVEAWVEDVKAIREQLHTLGDLTIISVPAI